jgi:hypothetical protein
MADSGVIDQIVSFWVEAKDSLLGTKGVGPVYSSLGHDELAAWWPHLAGHIQQGINTRDAPNGSLAYLTVATRSGQPSAILMRRVPALDPGGSRINTLTHVLIGSADLLTPRRALRMMRWQHWFGRGWVGELGLASTQVDPEFVSAVLPVQSLAIPDGEREGFAVVSPQRRNAVERLLAETLRHPDRPFVVPGALEEPDRVLYTVVDILGPAMHAVPGVSWTFSTFENEELGPDGPRYLFVARRSRSPYESGRVCVNGLSAQTGAEDEIDRLADDLVSFYEEEGGRELAEFIAAKPMPHGIGDVSGWIGDLGRRLAAYHGDELRLLRRALATGTPLGVLDAGGMGSEWWSVLPAQIATMDPGDFGRLLQQWQSVPSVHRGGTRNDAVNLVTPAIRAALGSQALRAAFGFASGDDGGRRVMALDAAVECLMTPSDVFDQLEGWWGTLGRSGQGDLEARLRVLDTALQASLNAVEKGFATAADFDRRRAAAVAADVVAGVSRLSLVEGLHRLAERIDLPLFLLTDLAERLPPAGSDDRGKIREFLGRPDVAFLSKTLAGFPPNELARAQKNIVDAAFGEDDFDDRKVFDQVVDWARNGTMDDRLILLFQDKADESGARSAVGAVALYHSDRFRNSLGHSALLHSGAPGRNSPAPPQPYIPGPVPTPSAPPTPPKSRRRPSHSKPTQQLSARPDPRSSRLKRLGMILSTLFGKIFRRRRARMAPSTSHQDSPNALRWLVAAFGVLALFLLAIIFFLPQPW